MWERGKDEEKGKRFSFFFFLFLVWVQRERWGKGRKRTVTFNLPVQALDHLAQLGPFRQVLEVEADVVRLGEVVEVGRGEVEEVVGTHGADCRHCYRARFALRVAVAVRRGLGGPRERWVVMGGFGGLAFMVCRVGANQRAQPPQTPVL